MSELLSLAKELPSILGDYQKIVYKKIAIISIITLGLIGYLRYSYSIIKALDYYYIEWWLPSICLLLTYLIWAIYTNRLVFRDRWWFLLWSMIYLSGIAAFPFWIYPKYIETTILNLPFIQTWGIFIIAVPLYFILIFIKRGFNLHHSRKMIIVFYVDSSKINVESKIRDSIKEAIASIESQFQDIEIIVPPFGFKSNIKKCERYIKKPYMQADALIYARVIDGNEDGQLGYVFTKFTSRVNSNRHCNYNNSTNEVLDGYLEQQRNFKEWNNLNIAKNEIISKVKIAENLEGMLLMYCSALYMLKNDYITALPIAKKMYNIEKEVDNSPVCLIAKQLLQFAYLASATHKEHITHDYISANNDIMECVRLFPALKSENAYLKTMARILFFLGDIKTSKLYTKRFKNDDNLCGYYLNMGFYAMYENKVREYTNHYKNLIKQKAFVGEIKFAVEFLRHQLNTSNSDQYRMLLKLSIAILTTVYIDSKSGKKLIMGFKQQYSSAIDEDIIKLIDKVQSTNY